MAYQKLQPTQALAVIANDDINPIGPSRSANLSGTAGTAETNKLNDPSVVTVVTSGDQDDTPVAFQLMAPASDFLTDGVAVGDTILNTTDDTDSTVVSIDSAIQLTLADDIMTNLSDTFTITRGDGFIGTARVGDLVLKEATEVLKPVTSVARTQLSFASDIFPTEGVGYKVYGNAAQMNSNTEAFILYVGGSGAAATWADVKVTTAAGNVVAFNHVPTGTILPIQCTRVWATGTDPVTNLVALW